MKYYYNGVLYDEVEIDELAREEIGKCFNGYPSDEMVEQWLDENVEELEEE